MTTKLVMVLVAGGGVAAGWVIRQVTTSSKVSQELRERARERIEERNAHERSMKRLELENRRMKAEAERLREKTELENMSQEARDEYLRAKNARREREAEERHRARLAAEQERERAKKRRRVGGAIGVIIYALYRLSGRDGLWMLFSSDSIGRAIAELGEAALDATKRPAAA